MEKDKDQSLGDPWAGLPYIQDSETGEFAMRLDKCLCIVFEEDEDVQKLSLYEFISSDDKIENFLAQNHLKLL